MSDGDEAFLHKNGKFFNVISPETEELEDQNLACRPTLPLLLPVPNFIMIAVANRVNSLLAK